MLTLSMRAVPEAVFVRRPSVGVALITELVGSSLDVCTISWIDDSRVGVTSVACEVDSVTLRDSPSPCEALGVVAITSESTLDELIAVGITVLLSMVDFVVCLSILAEDFSFFFSYSRISKFSFSLILKVVCSIGSVVISSMVILLGLVSSSLTIDGCKSAPKSNVKMSSMGLSVVKLMLYAKGMGLYGGLGRRCGTGRRWELGRGHGGIVMGL
jgi:hypothetical protein